MEWVLSHLATERQIIEGAPLHFVFAVVLLTALVWLLLRYFYRERIDSLTQIVGLYKDRYGAIDAESRTPLGRLRNSQLKKKAERLATGIDGLVEKLNSATEEQIAEQIPAKLTGMFAHVSALYEQDFKQDAILLRAEMSNRITNHGLIDPGPAMMGMGRMAFEHPTNTHGYREVSSELRRLAKLLP